MCLRECDVSLHIFYLKLPVNFSSVNGNSHFVTGLLYQMCMVATLALNALTVAGRMEKSLKCQLIILHSLWSLIDLYHKQL